MTEYPQVNPRKPIIEAARRDLKKTLADWSDRHELTPLEELALLAEASADVAEFYSKEERNNTP